MVSIASVIAANRFGLGARPGDLLQIDRDPRGWLLQQIAPPYRRPAELQALPSSAQILVDLQDGRMQARQAQRADSAAARRLLRAQQDLRAHYRQQADVRIRLAAATDEPFRERLVHFWTNHFAVSADKPPVTGLAGAFENEAVRPQVTGRFAELLLAAVRHPAMLSYLDNQRSIGPDSPLARRAERRRRLAGVTVGLNENLAREILELHTLGVDGGYSQADVVEFARALTGWTLSGEQRLAGSGTQSPPGGFEFRAELHQPGARRILGKRYAQRGADQAESVLSDLAMHPATARHICTKLAVHFVADAPPAALIADMTESFLATAGDLPAVYRTLVTSDAVWTAPLSKYKTPNDYLISALRAIALVPDNAQSFINTLDLLGQPPYMPGSPAGWPDSQAHWDSGEALLKRVEWAIALGRRIGDRMNPAALADVLLGPLATEHTRQTIARAPSAGEGVALLLASPEFQRR